MPELTFDFNDGPSVLDAIEVARENVAEADRAVAAAQEEASEWRAFLAVLERRAEKLNLDLPPPPKTSDDEPPSNGPPPTGKLSSTAVAIRVLDVIGGAATVAQVHERMTHFSRKTTGWALWKAEQEGKIRKLSQGVYAPLSYTMTELQPPIGAMEP